MYNIFSSLLFSRLLVGKVNGIVALTDAHPAVYTYNTNSHTNFDKGPKAKMLYHFTKPN